MLARGWMGRGFRLQTWITTSCLLSFILFGYDQGVFSGILQNEHWQNQFGNPSDVLTGLIVSSYTMGCIVGCVINFFIGERLGARRGLRFAMVLICAGGILQASAYGLAHLFVGRIFTGLGTGIKSSTVPPYQSELCPARWRGRLVSAQLLFVAVGVVFAYWLDYGVSFVGGPFAWRFPLAFQTAFAILVIGFTFDLPDSPRWLMKKGRRDEASSALARVLDRDVNEELVAQEIADIADALGLEAHEASNSWLDIFKADAVKTRRRVILAYIIMIMDQASGINLVVFYVPSALTDNVGMESGTAAIVAGCVQIVFMLGSVVPTFTLDRMGRRRTMMWGCFGLGFSMMMIAILLSFADRDFGTQTSSASVAFFFLYMLVFGLTVNVVPWVYVPEILPLHARIRGSALAISSEWLWNFIVVMISPIIINRLQWKAYLIFMAINYSFVPIIYLFYPETSRLSLEDIDYIFIDGDGLGNVAGQQEKIREKQMGPTTEESTTA